MNDSESIDSSAGATLGDIADQIDEQHKGALTAARTALRHASECGRLLANAKSRVPHGKWLDWLNLNTEVEPRQAQRYVRIWANRDRLNTTSGTHSTISEAIKLISKPKNLSLVGGLRAYSPALPPIEPKGATLTAARSSDNEEKICRIIRSTADNTPLKAERLSSYINGFKSLVYAWNQANREERQAFLDAMNGLETIILCGKTAHRGTAEPPGGFSH